MMQQNRVVIKKQRLYPKPLPSPGPFDHYIGLHYKAAREGFYHVTLLHINNNTYIHTFKKNKKSQGHPA